VPLKVIQGASARADHEHSRSTLTVRVPFPPAAGIVEVLWVMDMPQRGEGAATLVSEELPHAEPKSRSATKPAAAMEVRGAMSGTLMTQIVVTTTWWRNSKTEHAHSCKWGDVMR
jgi:hypothetical protein